MIRHRQGGDFLLVAQDDHARLSGRLAEQIGNDRFAPPVPRGLVIEGIALHDCGWPLHDENPTLDSNGLPLHVLQTPMAISTRVWSEGAQRTANVDPYSGLLVSLHVLNLSAYVAKQIEAAANADQRRHDVFLLNQFQQDQIELQEQLRRRLDMQTNLPLRLGLATGPALAADDREKLLAFNYGLLKLTDRLSLDACCDKPLSPSIDGVLPRPGEAPINLRLEHLGPGHLAIDPWPFAADRIEGQVPCRRVSAEPFPDEPTFGQAYAQARAEVFDVSISPL